MNGKLSWSKTEIVIRTYQIVDMNGISCAAKVI